MCIGADLRFGQQEMRRIQAGVGRRKSKVRITTKEFVQECSARAPKAEKEDRGADGNILQCVGVACPLQSEERGMNDSSEGIGEVSTPTELERSPIGGFS